MLFEVTKALRDDMAELEHGEAKDFEPITNKNRAKTIKFLEQFKTAIEEAIGDLEQNGIDTKEAAKFGKASAQERGYIERQVFNENLTALSELILYAPLLLSGKISYKEVNDFTMTHFKPVDDTPEFDMVLELADLLGVSPSEVIRLLVNDNYGSAGDGEK